MINLPFSNKNEHISKKFCGKLEFYTNGKVKCNIIWTTKKINLLFKIKDNVKILFVLYNEEIVVEEINHVRETMTNAITRIDEREQPIGKSESSKHLRNNPGHELEWIILSRAPSHHLKRKILEAYFIYFIDLNQFLNDQLESKILILFRHGVT